MQFNKKVIFLGYKSMTLKDGAVLNALSFFDPVDQDGVQVNVPATNKAVSDLLGVLSFGASCDATFALRPADKLYRLALAGLSASK